MKNDKKTNKKNRSSFQLSTFDFHLNRGFTLIEMMVALSLFTVVITVSLGSLLSIIDANKKSQAIQSLMTNLNFVMDDISRNARVGSNYHCSDATNALDVTMVRNCPSGDTLFAFEPTRGNPSSPTDQVVYRFVNSGTGIEKSSDGGSSFVKITSSNITLDQMKFFVVGALSGDSQQPRVVIVMKGVAGVEDKIKTNFNIQTTITQRILDI